MKMKLNHSVNRDFDRGGFLNSTGNSVSEAVETKRILEKDPF